MDNHLIINSFNYCGLVDSSNLHKVFDKLVYEELLMNEILEDEETHDVSNRFIPINEFSKE